VVFAAHNRYHVFGRAALREEGGLDTAIERFTGSSEQGKMEEEGKACLAKVLQGATAPLLEQLREALYHQAVEMPSVAAHQENEWPLLDVDECAKATSCTGCLERDCSWCIMAGQCSIPGSRSCQGMADEVGSEGQYKTCADQLAHTSEQAALSLSPEEKRCAVHHGQGCESCLAAAGCSWCVARKQCTPERERMCEGSADAVGLEGEHKSCEAFTQQEAKYTAEKALCAAQGDCSACLGARCSWCPGRAVCVHGHDHDDDNDRPHCDHWGRVGGRHSHYDTCEAFELDNQGIRLPSSQSATEAVEESISAHQDL